MALVTGDGRRGAGPAVVRALLAFMLVGCAASNSPTTSPTLPAPSLSSSAGPTDSPTDSPPVEPVPTPGPLPQPTLTQPPAIGEALSDPAGVPEAVVSLVDMMGIGIYADDGQVIRQGDERDDNDLSVSETEVRNLIQQGVDDASAFSAEGQFPFSFSDLGAALQPLLTDWPTERLAATYDQAYRDQPDGLAAQVMLGQPIAPSTPLSRVHIWLLYVDGFVSPAAAPTALAPGFRVAQASSWGMVNVALPNPQLPGWATEWASLFAAHAILGLDLQLQVTQTSGGGHEGHGRSGPKVTLTARILTGITGGLGRFPWGGPPIVRREPRLPVNLTWEADDPLFLSRHGTLSQPLGAPTLVPPDTGSTALTYQIRQEPSDGRGRETLHSTEVDASINTNELVTALYNLPPQFNGFFLGRTMGSYAALYVEWHQLASRWDVRIVWTDSYNGIPDTFTFVGVVDIEDNENSVGGVRLMKGFGIVTGDRTGWKECNPGIEMPPGGSGLAEFHAVVGEETVTVSAFASADSGLAGISTAGFEADIDGETVDFPRSPAAGEPCPHYSYGKATITPVDY